MYLHLHETVVISPAESENVAMYLPGSNSGLRCNLAVLRYVTTHPLASPHEWSFANNLIARGMGTLHPQPSAIDVEAHIPPAHRFLCHVILAGSIMGIWRATTHVYQQKAYAPTWGSRVLAGAVLASSVAVHEGGHWWIYRALTGIRGNVHLGPQRRRSDSLRREAGLSLARTSNPGSCFIRTKSGRATYLIAGIGAQAMYLDAAQQLLRTCLHREPPSWLPTVGLALLAMSLAPTTASTDGGQLYSAIMGRPPSSSVTTTSRMVLLTLFAQLHRRRRS